MSVIVDAAGRKKKPSFIHKQKVTDGNVGRSLKSF